MVLLGLHPRIFQRRRVHRRPTPFRHERSPRRADRWCGCPLFALLSFVRFHPSFPDSFLSERALGHRSDPTLTHLFDVLDMPLEPHSQLVFAAATVAIATGGMSGRGRNAPMLVWQFCWLTLVYAPIAHWVWAAEVGGLDVGLLPPPPSARLRILTLTPSWSFFFRISNLAPSGLGVQTRHARFRRRYTGPRLFRRVRTGLHRVLRSAMVVQVFGFLLPFPVPISLQSHPPRTTAQPDARRLCDHHPLGRLVRI